MCYSHTIMRNIRIVLEDEDAKLLDEIREINKCTYRDLLLLSLKTKQKGLKNE